MHGAVVAQTLPAGRPRGQLWPRVPATCGPHLEEALPLPCPVLQLCTRTSLSPYPRHPQTKLLSAPVISWAPDYRNSPRSSPVHLVPPMPSGWDDDYSRDDFTHANYGVRIPRESLLTSVYGGSSVREGDRDSVRGLRLTLEQCIPGHTFSWGGLSDLCRTRPSCPGSQSLFSPQQWPGGTLAACPLPGRHRDGKLEARPGGGRLEDMRSSPWGTPMSAECQPRANPEDQEFLKSRKNLL